MANFDCEKIWYQNRWHDRFRVVTDASGKISKIAPQPQSDPAAATKLKIVIPGIQNNHSHSFQFMMAGLVESHSSHSEDFWSWRQRMYQIAGAIEPEDLYAITRIAYKAMLKAGYLAVTEFHYLHFDKNGKPYAKDQDFCQAIQKAAADVGIYLCLIPVFYKNSYFDAEPLAEQRRFMFRSIDQYLEYLDRRDWQACERFTVGSGVHSVRAAPPPLLAQILNDKTIPGPKHLHISEQMKEVKDYHARYQQTPIEWLLRDISSPCNLVHATHANSYEIAALASSDHSVILCPHTEANLGDGIFSLADYHERGGRWSIGSDSNTTIDPFAELRLLDYGQRLQLQSRSPLLSEEFAGSFIRRAAHDAAVSKFGPC